MKLTKHIVFCIKYMIKAEQTSTMSLSVPGPSCSFQGGVSYSGQRLLTFAESEIQQITPLGPLDVCSVSALKTNLFFVRSPGAENMKRTKPFNTIPASQQQVGVVLVHRTKGGETREREGRWIWDANVWTHCEGGEMITSPPPEWLTPPSNRPFADCRHFDLP